MINFDSWSRELSSLYFGFSFSQTHCLPLSLKQNFPECPSAVSTLALGMSLLSSVIVTPSWLLSVYLLFKPRPSSRLPSCTFCMASSAPHYFLGTFNYFLIVLYFNNCPRSLASHFIFYLLFHKFLFYLPH